MRLSNYFFYTLREDVKDEESVSGKLLTKAGLIRKIGAGIYSYTPMGLKVVKKVENIIREEMNNAGANEVLMSALIPAEVYAESGRLENFGASMFRLNDRNKRPMTLGPTHEELFTKMAYAKGNSYKNLPFTLYQIQTKFRDEPRARYGLIRVKEFIMKDAYSFDTDEAGLDISYKKMYDAYHKIMQRLAIKYAVIKADTGVMGGTLSEEFQAITPIGEDTVITCDSCDFASNIEVAECKTTLKKSDEKEEKIEKVSTPHVGTIEEVSKFLNLPADKFVKTLIYMAGEEVIAVLVRGDREVNEVKVRKLLKLAGDIELADEETVARVTGARVGFAGPVGLEGVKIIVDDEVTLMKNYIVGGNETDYHYINVNIDRDYKADVVGDIKNISENDVCPVCGGKLTFNAGIEVGNTFKLGSKYSKALNCLYLDKDNVSKPYEMGSYGIGIGRCLAAMVEQSNDDNGIIWPTEEVAPFEVIVVPVNIKDELQMAEAERIYSELIKAGVEAVIDDRDERAGVKFKDADLIGIPKRIVVGKGIAGGEVEYKERTAESAINVSKDEIVKKIIG